MSDPNGFTPEQASYLQGLALGSDVRRKVLGLPIVSGSGGPGTTITLGTPNGEALSPSGPVDIHRAAQDRQVAAGKQLCAEELAKRDKNGLDIWDEMLDRAAKGEFPKGTDVLLTKFQGMFYVAPAQNAYMCRLRFPGGALRSWQMRGLADLADQFAGGYSDVTTRANLQLREIDAGDPVNVLIGLRDLGIINVGSGADNIRNVTASPLSGIDPTELVETLPLAREMHHYILNHRELYGMPRKFNIAFDGGGAISALEDTNDIGFHAVEVCESEATTELPAGVYFQLALGGITGHKDFARYTGVLLRPEECVPAAAAIVRVFIAHGDRTDRKKARLKYLLDDWGFEKFLEEVDKVHGTPIRRVPIEKCAPRRADDRQAHIGVHPQKQLGQSYVGLVLPVGRLTSDQMRAVADLAEQFGNGELRLTVWQNLLVPNIPNDRIDAATAAVEAMGLDWRASCVRAGLVACTGNAGCKYAASDTKRHAMAIANHVEQTLELDQPVNIHLTGCHHSCAQHYIGDIGLLGANVDDGDDTIEGYHVHVGGGWGERQAIGREIFTSVPHDKVPDLVATMLERYLESRSTSDESFAQFTARHETEQLRELFGGAIAVG
jgi:ferredoxin-nitrite reductase